MVANSLVKTTAVHGLQIRVPSSIPGVASNLRADSAAVGKPA
jgi:hypothetical protein